MALSHAHSGYEYQDLLTVYFVLKEILTGNYESKFDVDKKHYPNDRFDDLTICSPKGIQRKQIKYSDKATSKKLTKDDLSNDNNYSLAIYELFDSWKHLNTANSEFRLCLAWDEPTDENIKKVLVAVEADSSFDYFATKLYKIDIDKLWVASPENFNRWENLKKYVKENGVNRVEFQHFCDSLLIELELPKEEELKDIVYLQVEQLGIGQYPNNSRSVDDFIEVFAKKVNGYRSNQAENITIRKILEDLKVQTDFGKIEQKFEIDDSKNIVLENKFEHFYEEIIRNKKTALVGDPGSGKSWFLTNFMSYAKDKNIKVVRHYCFTGTDEDLRLERIKSDVFFGNLIADIIENFPQLQQFKEKLFASNLNELNLLLSHITENIILIIDGLDHIDRILSSSVSVAIDEAQIVNFIRQIESHDNVSIVLGSQSIVEIDDLTSQCGYVRKEISRWQKAEIIELMKRFKLEDVHFDSVDLSALLLEKSNGNPLYLTYLIRTVQTIAPIAIDTIESLPEYDFNLKNYYDHLTSQMDCNLASETLACLDFRVNKDELQEIIPRSSHLDKNLKILSPVLNENYSRGGIRLYHDSFRRFMFEKLSNNDLQAIYTEIISWLESKDFYSSQKSYRNLLAYYLLAKKYDKIRLYATDDFLAQSVFYGYSENAIKINYQYFLLAARMTQDWVLFVYLSEFNRALYTTISTEYYSEQLENFELYFEAVGLVHGFEYANSMLYYDGQKNFDDEYIAKGFYVSQKNGLTPNWSLLDAYFAVEINSDKFKYFIVYLIGANKIDKFCANKLKKLLSLRYEEFFKIFIIEVYSEFGFEKIVNIFDSIPKAKQLQYGNLINRILDGTACTSRVLVSKIKKPKLQKLGLDFAENYIREEDLESFAELIGSYFIYDCDSLRRFEKTIGSKNFFFNWVKFTIRSYLIEDDINKGVLSNTSGIEDAIVKNYKFLASDVEPYKGRPRTVDFTHQGKAVIQKSIERLFKYIQTGSSWKVIIESLNKIPFDYLDNINNIVNGKNVPYILSRIDELDGYDSDYYAEHLHYALKKSIIYSKLGKNEEAKRELFSASVYMTAYTSRKDITLSEIIEPLDSINKIAPKEANKYAKKLKYLNEAVQKHTEDGKDIRWLIIEWFEKLLVINHALASKYLIYNLLENEYFWKLDNMFVHFIIDAKNIDPVVLNFLHRVLPTNTKDELVKSYLDNCSALVGIDRSLAKSSIVDILNRDLNGSYETLSDKTMSKLSFLRRSFQIQKHIKTKKDDGRHNYPKPLDEHLNNYFKISKSPVGLSIDEIVDLFESDRLHISLALKTFYFLQENFDESVIKDCVSKIIKIKYRFYDDDYKLLRNMVVGLNISDNSKIYLLTQIFVYSRDGWYAMFVCKKAFVDAVKLDKIKSLEYLSVGLLEVFKNSGLGIASTANLIIAFKHAGIDESIILDMYGAAFGFIEARLPHKKEDGWKIIKKIAVDSMDKNEIALVVMLSKMKNLDTTVQQEIIYAVDYLLRYKHNLLEKPLKWFLDNLHYFPQSTIGAILEIMLLHVDLQKSFFIQFEAGLLNVKALKNLYLANISDEIIEKIRNV